MVSFGSDLTVLIFTAMSPLYSRVQRRMISVDNFSYFEIIIVCCVVAICDLVHDVETIFHLSYVPTASGNIF